MDDLNQLRFMFPKLDQATVYGQLGLLQPPNEVVPPPPNEVVPPPPNEVVPPPPNEVVPPPPGIPRPIPIRPIARPVPSAESRQEPPRAVETPAQRDANPVLDAPPEIMTPPQFPEPNGVFQLNQSHLPFPAQRAPPYTPYPMLSPLVGAPHYMHPSSFRPLPPPTPGIHLLQHRNQHSLVGNMVGGYPGCPTPAMQFVGNQYDPNVLLRTIFTPQIDAAHMSEEEAARQLQFVEETSQKKKKQSQKPQCGPPRKRGRPPKQQQQPQQQIIFVPIRELAEKLAQDAAHPSTSDGRTIETLHTPPQVTINSSTPASSLMETPRVLSEDLERNHGESGLGSAVFNNSSTASLASSPGKDTTQPALLAMKTTEDVREDEERPMEFDETGRVDSGDGGMEIAEADRMGLGEDQMEMADEQGPSTSSEVQPTDAEKLEEEESGEEVVLQDERYVCTMPARWCIGDMLETMNDVEWVSCDLCHRWFHCYCIWGTNDNYGEDGRSFLCCGKKQMAAAKKAFVGGVFEEFKLGEEFKKYEVLLSEGQQAAKQTPPKKSKKKKGRK